MDMEHNKNCHSLTAGLNKSSLFIFIEETVLKTSLLLGIIRKNLQGVRELKKKKTQTNFFEKKKKSHKAALGEKHNRNTGVWVKVYVTA